ncbi:MAG TPA: hypothetical protein EYM64_05215 [Phycisphaerales bacterium]|nr:hypothetical protein [Phycisphaerales bacterium]
MSRLPTLLFACVCLAYGSPLVLAATTAPPVPSLRKVPATWMGMGLMFIFFGIVIAISLISSKRGHQD